MTIKADYVILCDPAPQGRPDDTLVGQLAGGHAPPWLVPTGPSIWRVR